MSTTDFSMWVAPDMVLTLGGHTFKVHPPSVEGAKKCIAGAVFGEVRMGLAKGPIPDEIQEIIDAIGKDEHPSLGTAYPEMVTAGIDQQTIDRMSAYGIFFWARGKDYADSIATLLWSEHDVEAPAADDASPKA